MATIEDVMKLLKMQSDVAEKDKREREFERRKQKYKESERGEVRETINLLCKITKINLPNVARYVLMANNLQEIYL